MSLEHLEMRRRKDIWVQSDKGLVGTGQALHLSSPYEKEEYIDIGKPAIPNFSISTEGEKLLISSYIIVNKTAISVLSSEC